MIDEVKQAFCSLTAEQQARFLVRMLHESTMWARYSYPQVLPDPATAPEKLQGFNEFSHVLSGQARAILENNPNRYPDDVFFDILVEQACMTGCAPDVGKLLKQLIQ